MSSIKIIGPFGNTDNTTGCITSNLSLRRMIVLIMLGEWYKNVKLSLLHFSVAFCSSLFVKFKSSPSSPFSQTQHILFPLGSQPTVSQPYKNNSFYRNCNKIRADAWHQLCVCPLLLAADFTTLSVSLTSFEMEADWWLMN
jgi:hypothetical protein